MRAGGKREESRARKEGRPKKEKRLGIVSSYVTWMSNNFGARGCRISNVAAAASEAVADAADAVRGRGRHRRSLGRSVVGRPLQSQGGKREAYCKKR